MAFNELITHPMALPVSLPLLAGLLCLLLPNAASALRAWLAVLAAAETAGSSRVVHSLSRFGGVTVLAADESGLEAFLAAAPEARVIDRPHDIPQGNIRVIKPAVGGGFGAKAETTPLELLAVIFARKTGRPSERASGPGSGAAVSQDTACPAAQDGQSPQDRIRVTTTRCPASSPRTPGPQAVIRPDASCP